MVPPMNSAWLLPGARSNEKLERAGSAAAWYWACSISYLRDKQEKRTERGEPIDFIPENASHSLFADKSAKDHVKALVKHKLWHVVEGGFRVNDYVEVYGKAPGATLEQAGPADRQPEPADIPQPTPSQLGGMARSLTSRTPAGTFQPTPADNQPNASQLVQPAGVVSLTNPSDPEESQKLGNERGSREDLPENKGSGAGARGGRKRASALPADFGLTDEHIAFGATKDWPEWWMRNRCEQFCDLAAAKGWTYKDWKLALYTFLRNEITYGRGPAAIARFSSGSGGSQPAGFRPRGAVQNSHGKTGFEALNGGERK